MNEREPIPWILIAVAVLAMAIPGALVILADQGIIRI